MEPSSEILINFPSVFRIYKDLRVDRLIGKDTVPSGYDSSTGVTSKDVSIDSDAGLYARRYLCGLEVQSSDSSKKLPVLICYHGGAFVIQSADSHTRYSSTRWLPRQA